MGDQTQETNMSQKPNQHSVRRIILPSGRCIEVVRFHETDEPVHQQLHVCPECSSELVQPLEWSEAAGDRWELALECPNCWWRHEGLYGREQVAQLEEELDNGLTAILDDLRRLAQANMADEIDRFVGALEANVILPEDF
jgi:hypothetical protein